MSPRKAPIKISVIDEDEGEVATPKKEALPAKKDKSKKAISKKTPLKKTAIKTKASPVKAINQKTIADKKEIVTEVIEEDVLARKTSFEEKLMKELGQAGPMPITPKKQVIKAIEDVEPAEFEKELEAMEGESDVNLNQAPLTPSEDVEIQEIVKMKDRNSRSVSIYKRIAYFFILLVLVLLVTSAYFLLTKVTIVLVPDQERHSSNLIFDVQDKDASGNASRTKVSGVVKTVEIEFEKTYPATGSEVIGKEAVGTVTIINNYSKSQKLVATTRMLAATGELFRLKNTVNVPAGGEVISEIYADEPSPEMAIAPTKFNIPGLWAGLQDKIYAKSKETITYQQKIKKHVVQDDIDSATRDMRQQLLNQAKSNINKTYSDFDEIIYDIDEDTISSSIDAEVGDEVDETTVTMSAEIIVIAFESKEAALLAKEKFDSSIDASKEVLSFDSDNIIYSLNNYNGAEGIATINAAFEGKVSLRENSNVINKERIIGLNKKQLEIFLEEDNDLKDISGFDVKFQPSFLPEFLKKVPRLPERIIVEVKK